ncbi:GNAT family N-acetyltransferase [Agarivorans sp. MS3-6]|uniref:GNAT family N-acetyltransferase n=1 Tax=Agarivorans sp. TSD2052 TaxID=2937286 RepID=UPI00200F74B6|nr:GNAT family N-acetyltransferase [Agarivorans sp. TSD2052]UPW19775.1 GNAT family N-acetyltransferase [Agarivorans sp. TSD2052]
MPIQLAKAKHAAEISLVQRRSWQHVYNKKVTQAMFKQLPEVLHHRLWSQRLISPSYTTWVLARPNVQGFVMLDQQVEGVELTALYLDPQAMGKGWGRALFESASQSAKMSFATRLHCWVMEDNQHAQGFYRHLGFKFTGEQRELEFSGSPFIQKKAELVC